MHKRIWQDGGVSWGWEDAGLYAGAEGRRREWDGPGTWRMERRGCIVNGPVEA
jgi:hypothetical protein